MNFNLKTQKIQKEKTPATSRLLEWVSANFFRRGKNVVGNFYFYNIAFLGVLIESFKFTEKSTDSTRSEPLFGHWKRTTVDSNFRKLLSESGARPSQQRGHGAQDYRFWIYSGIAARRHSQKNIFERVCRFFLKYQGFFRNTIGFNQRSVKFCFRCKSIWNGISASTRDDNARCLTFFPKFCGMVCYLRFVMTKNKNGVRLRQVFGWDAFGQKLGYCVNERLNSFQVGLLCLHRIKNFLFPKLKYSSSRYFYRFFGNFYRRGRAAISEFRGGLSSPPAAAKTVRTISRIDHPCYRDNEEAQFHERKQTALLSEIIESRNDVSRAFGE